MIRYRFSESEAGFTLIEALITISLMAVLGGVLTQAFVVSLDSSAATRTSVDTSNRRQGLVKLLTEDIQAADDVWQTEDPDPALKCNAGTPEQHRLRTHRVDGAIHTVVSYLVREVDGDNQLERMICVYDEADLGAIERSEPMVVAAALGAGGMMVGCPDLPAGQCPATTTLASEAASPQSVTLASAAGFPATASPSYQIAVDLAAPRTGPEVMTVFSGTGVGPLKVIRTAVTPLPVLQVGGVVGFQPRQLAISIPFKGELDEEPSCPLPAPPAPGQPSDQADGCFQITVGRRLGTAKPAIADLAVVKTVSVEKVELGTPFDYSFAITNAGPDKATGVMIADDLPPGIVFVSSDTPDCTFTAPTVVCDLGPVGLSGDLRKITVKATAAGLVTNTATVSAGPYDPEPADNVSAVDITTGSADLSVILSDSADPVARNTEYDYTIAVTNPGPDLATGVKATDDLPAGLTFVSASTGCAVAAGSVTCEIGDIASGATETRSVRVKAAAAGIVTNEVSVTADQVDPVETNNSDDETTLVGSADLSIVKTDSADPVTLNTGFDYTFEVINTGPDTATGLEVSDDLPSGLTFVTASAGCDEDDGLVTCDFDDLASGATATKTITVKATAAGPIENTAVVEGGLFDPQPANNTESENTGTSP